MGGRKRKLTNAEIADIRDALLLDPTLTLREIAFKYQISRETLRRYLKQTEWWKEI